MSLAIIMSNTEKRDLTKPRSMAELEHSLPAPIVRGGSKENRLQRGEKNVCIYSELYVAVSKRCLELENISITEYVNRALAKVLNVPFRPRARRPYLPGSKLPVTSQGVFALLDLTPLGMPRKKKEESK